MTSLRWEPADRCERERGEQFGRCPLDGRADAEEVDERDVLLAAFEGADLVAMEPGQLAALLLTHACCLASFAYGATEGNQRIGHRPLIAHSDWW